MTEGTLRTFLSSVDKNSKESILKYIKADASITRYLIEEISKSDKELNVALLVSYIPKFIELKLSVEQINLFIDTYYTNHCLDKLCEAISLGFDMAQMKLLANPAYTDKQMNEIILGFKNGLSFNEVETYANPHVSNSKMYAIRVFFKKKYPKTQYKYLQSMDSICFQMMKDADIEKYDLDFDQIKFACLHSLNSKQFEQIILGFVDHLLEKEIKVYANPNKFDSEKMEFLRKALHTDMGLSDEALDFIASCTNLSTLQLNEVINGFVMELTVDQVEIYAKAHINSDAMNMIAYDIKQNVYLGNPEFYIFENGNYINLIRMYLEKGVSKERILSLISSFKSSEIRNMSFEDMMISALAGLTCKQILEYSNRMLFEYTTPDTRKYLISLCKKGITANEAEYIMHKEERKALDDKIVELFLCDK